MAEPIEIMLDDLGRQIAQKALEAAEWKTRALVAEATIEQLKRAEAEEAEGAALAVVPEAEEGEGDDA